MRVLLLTTEFPPRLVGGLGVVAHRQAADLARLGLDVTVVARGGRRPRLRRDPAGFRVLWLPARRPWWRGARVDGRAAWRALRRRGLHRADAALVHHPDLLPLVRRCRASGLPVVYHCHSLLVEELKGRRSPRRRRQEALLRLAACVLVGSEAAAAALARHYPRRASRVRVLPPRVDLPADGPPAARHPARLLFVGRLTPLKGLEVLLRALARVARERPEVRLDVAGRAASARRLRRLRALIRRLGLTGRVRLLGWLGPARLAQAYRRATAVVVPSLAETFGLVAHEALAHGAPLVASDAGALAEIPADAAFRFPAGDAAALARTLIRVLSQPEVAAARARAGQAWVRRRAGPEAARRLAELLRRLAAERGARPAEAGAP